MTDSEMLKMIIADMQGMQQDMEDIKQEVGRLDRKVAAINLHLENTTDKNIWLLADNCIDLTDKLNRAILVANKNYAYEVKLNYLLEKVAEIEKKVKSI